MISYTLTQAELVEALRYRFRKSPALRFLRLLVIGVIIWGAVQAVRACVYYGCLFGPADLVWPLTLLAALWLPTLLLPLSARRQYRSARWMREEQQFGWSGDGVEFHSAVNDSRFLWSDFRRWDESRNLIVMVQPSGAIMVMPKRAFSSQQLDDFRKQLGAHVRRPGMFRRATG